jgi:hypothetical protein
MFPILLTYSTKSAKADSGAAKRKAVALPHMLCRGRLPTTLTVPSKLHVDAAPSSRNCQADNVVFAPWQGGLSTEDTCVA